MKSFVKSGVFNITIQCRKQPFGEEKTWAQEHYPQWRKVFLFDGRVDLKEYQKFESFYSEKQYEAHQDPHLKILEEMQ